ncbi:MAG: molybdopterin cofactor-binding domain-containing protein [Pseudomonadota bacterium]
MTDPAPLTPSFATNPSLDRWIRFGSDRTVLIGTGKVEIGQGIVTAIAQIAAEELDLDLDAVQMVSGDTTTGPNELYTTSSLSVEVSGASVRIACAEARARLLDRLAQRLNCGRDELSVDNGEFLQNGRPTGYDYWRVAPETDLTTPVQQMPDLKPPTAYRTVGRSVARLDLPAKVSGAAFLHDMQRPNLLHARVLRQPDPAAELESVDQAAIQRAAGGALRFVRTGDFVAVVSADEAIVERAARAAPERMRWRGMPSHADTAGEAAWLYGRKAKHHTIGAPSTSPEHPGQNRIEAHYSRPYVAHASMGPSCALAEMRDGHLTVWSHGQGMHPLRQALANTLGMDAGDISAFHRHGPGCYGHNGADDASLDAALIALEMPGHTIRVMWRREDEFLYEPLGSAMQVRLQVWTDEHWRPVDWTTEIWSGVHVQRPGRSGGNLLAATSLPEKPAPLDLNDPPEDRGGGATRNAVPLYDIPAHRIEHHLVTELPVRTSALRGLGALPNVFAIECMLDELAERAEADPLAFRLELLSDERAQHILRRVAVLANWSARPAPGTGTGYGIGMAQYKNRSAYAAVIVALNVDQQVRLEHIWCVADAGLVVNPDGARNQIEGGIIQGASMALKEQVQIDRNGNQSRDWDSYPILRFTEIPPVDVELVDAKQHRSLGVGECSLGPTAAAIGNAVAHALGARVRDMPLTRDRIAAALLPD